jgi:hypothetical protein
MKTLPLVAWAVLVAATLAAGWAHGRMTNRKGLRAEASLAGERLKPPLPAETGNWRLVSENQFEPDVVRMLQCPAHISRVYEHRQTGDVVTVAVIVGPPGPVSVHTPEICYSSRDYTIMSDRQQIAISDAAGLTHALWELPLKPNDLNGAPLRVVYAWSSGAAWEASRHPRFGFGGLPYLYKIQLAATDHPASEAINFDPVQDFLANFLAQLQPRLMDTANPSAPSR